MIVFEIVNREDNQVYKDLEQENGERHYDFLRSVVLSSIALQKPFLSADIIKALNFHAIACLHIHSGEYRPCEVHVGNYQPPEYIRVRALMDDFVNTVNRAWDSTEPLALAAYVLWRLNYIHPFINGNGRTARASCYFVLCMKLGSWLPGAVILPELIHRHRENYVVALQKADESWQNGTLDLTLLHDLLAELLQEQLDTVK